MMKIGLNFLVILLFHTRFLFISAASASPPNVIFVVADDLGWDDVGYHGSTQVKTPNIDKFANNNLRLESHYVNPLCSPSRASLLTGRYASSLGLQHSVIIQGQKVGVPLNETMLSEHLRGAGYATHAIGKWHLGYFANEYTPTGRGFDTFYGYYNENADYWDHTSNLDYVLTDKKNIAWGLDWRFDANGNFTLIHDDFGKYSTDILTDRAIEVLQNYSSVRETGVDQPFFMYLAYQAVHSGNQDRPLQAPQEDVNQFPYIWDSRRRVTAGMIYNLDKNFGRLMDAVESEGHLDNTIIVFLTDNGGPTLNCDYSWGSNYPLRGSKHALYEGGVRGVALARIPQMLSSSEQEEESQVVGGGKVREQLMHVSDWLPTVLDAVGIEIPEQLDGVSQYGSLVSGGVSARTELLHNVDQWTNYSAIRVNHIKLIMGKWHNGYGGCDHFADWATPPGDTPISSYVTTNPTVQCNGIQPDHRESKDDCWSDTLQTTACMYNISSDPCEYKNIIDDKDLSDVRDQLMERLNYYYAKALPPNWPIPDPKSLPPLHNFTWVPWVTDIEIKH